MKTIRTLFVFRFILPVLLSFVSAKTLAQGDELMLKGELIQGGVVIGHLPPGAEISLDGKSLAQSATGHFVFGFGRDANETSLLTWRSEKGEFSKTLSIVQREYLTQYVEGVPQKTVSPAPEKLARIRKETALVKAARNQLHKLEHFTQVFQLPLDGRKTGVYGSQRFYNGVPKRPHFGVDYAAPTGTPVVAPADAVVTLVHPDMFYSGGTLIMDHGYGLSSTFIHLSEVTVNEGDVIKAGQVVGKVGAGGRATGPHLDWRLNWYQVRLDPELILNGLPSIDLALNN